MTGETGAINFTILMHNGLCNINADSPALDSRKYRSDLGNLEFPNSIMILDHISGGILPGTASGIVLRYELTDARSVAINQGETRILPACQKLDRVSRVTVQTDANGRDYERRQFFQLSEPLDQNDIRNRDVSRGRYYPNHHANGNFEVLTCEYVNESLLQDAGSVLSGSSVVPQNGNEIVIPQETKVESAPVPPLKTKKVESAPVQELLPTPLESTTAPSTSAIPDLVPAPTPIEKAPRTVPKVPEPQVEPSRTSF